MKLVSYQAHLNKRKNIDISVFQDINTKLINCYYEHIINDYNTNNNLNKKLINEFGRKISCDGSQLNFLFSLSSDFYSNKHNTYSYANLNCLYDIDNKIPISYVIDKKDERSLLISQLNYLNKNDILIADRGYYSDELANELNKKNINFVLRISKHIKYYIDNKDNIETIDEDVIKIKNEYGTESKPFLFLYWYSTRNTNNEQHNELNKIIISIKKLTDEKLFNKNQCKLYKHQIANLFNKNKLLIKKIDSLSKDKIKNKKKINLLQIKLKENRKEKKKLYNDINKYKNENNSLIKKINELYKEKQNIELNLNSKYIILTNYESTLKEIKETYKERWSVETHFKFAKEIFKFDSMDTKNINFVKQNILITQTIFIIESYMEYILNKKINKNKMINKTAAFESLKNKLLFLLLKNKDNTNNKKILELLEILINFLVEIIKTIKYKERIRKRPQKNHYNTNIK